MTAAGHEAAVRRSQPHPLAGFGHLFRFMVRRDRLRAPLWIGAIIGLVIASAASALALYDTPAGIKQYADLATADPALKALAGPGYGLDNPTDGAVVMNEVEMYSFIGIALMCIFLMIRHTRAEEESDRAELVRAAAVGRLAILAAAVTWVAILTVVVAAGLVAGLTALGIEAVGSAGYAAAGLGLGLAFIGVSAVTAQVAASARAATSMAGAVLGLSFLLRAVGDLGTAGISWASPLGWALNIRAFAGERWWVLALLGGTSVALVATGITLSAHRDLGAGILTQRPGPAEAGARLASPLAMAARLQRPLLIGWTIGTATLGLFFGIVSDQADQILQNEAIANFIAQAGGGSPVDAFLATLVLMIGLLVAGFTISSALRMRTEESAGRAAAVLSTSIGRPRWMLSSLMVTFAGTAILMVVAGLTLGLGYALQVRDFGQVMPVVGAAVNLLPALFVLAAIAAALIGLRPQWAPLAWAGLALAVTVGLLAETLRLPQWLRDASPFEHPAALPAESFHLLPVAGLLGLSGGLLAVGLTALRRRDIG